MLCPGPDSRRPPVQGQAAARPGPPGQPREQPGLPVEDPDLLDPEPSGHPDTRGGHTEGTEADRGPCPDLPPGTGVRNRRVGESPG